MRIVGYEFLVEITANAQVWLRLRGIGGLMGDGALHYNCADRLLKRAQDELERYGSLYKHVDLPNGGFESRKIKPRRVVDCRPIVAEVD